MAQVNMHEAKTQLSRLVERALAGEEIVIAKAGKPAVKLVPHEEKPPPRKPGGWEGKVWYAPDFDEGEFSEEMVRLFEGEESWWPDEEGP